MRCVRMTQALSSDGHKVLVSKALREMTLSTSDVCAALIDSGCMQVLAKLAKAELAEVSSLQFSTDTVTCSICHLCAWLLHTTLLSTSGMKSTHAMFQESS
jgi:aconitase B